MSSTPITRNEKPQMLIISTLYKTKKFLTKSFTHLKPKPPIFMDSKLQELDDCYTSFSEKCVANPNLVEVVTKKKEGNASETAEGKKDRAEESRRERKWSARKQEESLAQKMKDLEMMDLNDRDQAMDVEEVLHYYSRLTCPAYVEIVDQFFMDMYSEFHVLRGRSSLNASMRKLALETNYTSMRSLAPLRL